MKKLLPIILMLAVVFFSSYLFAQETAYDTIFSHNKVIVCDIQEIDDAVVKYSYPKEDIIISINKNMINKVVFSSGRVESFASSTIYKDVNGWEDWQKVSLTPVSDEISGLYRMGDVSSKVKAGSEFSNENKIKDKALRKIRIRAAMLGANVVFLTNDHTEGHRYNMWTGGTNTAEVLLTGVAYSNRVPHIEKFKKLISKKPIWNLVQIVKMPYNKKKPTIIDENETIDLSNYTISGYFIHINYKGEEYTVIRVEEDKLILMKQGDRRIYNYILV